MKASKPLVRNEGQKVSNKDLTNEIISRYVLTNLLSSSHKIVYRTSEN